MPKHSKRIFCSYSPWPENKYISLGAFLLCLLSEHELLAGPWNFSPVKPCKGALPVATIQCCCRCVLLPDMPCREQRNSIHESVQGWQKFGILSVTRTASWNWLVSQLVILCGTWMAQQYSRQSRRTRYHQWYRSGLGSSKDGHHNRHP